MKTRRQERILELIKEHHIETQSELLEMLRKDGFHVTQATVSRDIKEMRLIKILGPNGTYQYAAEMLSGEEPPSHSYLFSTAVVSVDSAHTLVVIKTQIGMAQAVCAALDATDRSGVLGTIAGDDTIFILCRSEENAENFTQKLRKMLNA